MRRKRCAVVSCHRIRRYGARSPARAWRWHGCRSSRTRWRLCTMPTTPVAAGVHEMGNTGLERCDSGRTSRISGVLKGPQLRSRMRSARRLVLIWYLEQRGHRWSHECPCIALSIALTPIAPAGKVAHQRPARRMRSRSWRCMAVRAGPNSSMSTLRHVGMGFEDRAKARRRAGWRWIEGAAMAVVCVLFFCAYGYGLALDEDPMTGPSAGVTWAVILGGLIAAAVMLRRGIMLIRSARRQQRRQQKAHERARRKR
jgi:hypothetical protein